MASPKVSIIIPVYKTAKYLSKCLDSVLKQTYQDFEVILVCDGEEEEYKICEQYANLHKNFTLLTDIKKGLGGARNAGINAANGEYLWFIDSDDWAEPNALECTLECFNKENDIDIVVFSANMPKEFGCIKQKGLSRYLINKYSGKTELTNDVIFDTNVYVWNKIFKKSVIDNNKILFPENLQYEDFSFFYQYCESAQNAYFISDKLYNYLQRKTSGMAQSFKSKIEYIKQHIDVLEFLYNRVKDKNYYAQIYSLILGAGLKLCNKNNNIEYLEYAYNTYKKLNLTSNNLINLIQLENKEYDKLIKKIVGEHNIKFLNFIPITVRETKKQKIKYYLFNKFFIFQRTVKKEAL